MAEKILFVDDDPNILSGFRRILRNRFEVETASGGEVALQVLKKDSSFAVIVSDYRMPGMNGVEFLTQALQEWPDAVRVLLTGEADMKAAGAAVNQGQIYRFLVKPCPAMILEKTLGDAVKHHHLITAEKSLLERTLQGSMEMLTEILTLVQPGLFGRSSRVYRTVVQMLPLINVSNRWEFEIAAMLSHIGCVTVPPQILEKLAGKSDLSEAEKATYSEHLKGGAKLIERIPRLEVVAQIIARQGEARAVIPAWQALEKVDRVTLGCYLLSLAAYMETAISSHLAQGALAVELRSMGYPPAFIKVAEEFAAMEAAKDIKTIRSNDLASGMILEADIVADNGLLLLAKGQWLSETLLQCLRRHYEYCGHEEQLQVRVPADATEGGGAK